jgi:AbrB family looped-hinge helix DNA binding protein
VETVVVSSRFRIVIPKPIRTALGIRPEQKLQLIQYEDRIELIPIKPMREMRGFLKASTQLSRAIWIALEPNSTRSRWNASAGPCHNSTLKGELTFSISTTASAALAQSGGK